jgi:acyl-CoA synthetase (AMP-forming)/AMP-acid ligase II
MNRATAALQQKCPENWAERLFVELESCPDRAFCTQRSELSWAEWAELVRALKPHLGCLAGGAVGLLFRPLTRSYATLWALTCLGCHVFLFDERTDPAMIRAMGRDHGLREVLDPGCDEPLFRDQVQPLPAPAGSNVCGRITIFTSGSTGLPKAVTHDWDTLTRPVRVRSTVGTQTWLLTYRPQLYAGLQVFLHCLLNRGALVIPEEGMAVQDLIALIRKRKVSHISATPSYWRRLITLGSSADLRTLKIEQITLGGEACDQALLDGLKRLFPDARLVHIYATSELGRCFSVKDVRAGFPARFLDGPTEEGIELRLEDGELLVRSANAMLEGPTGQSAADRSGTWMPTGDLIEQSGDRCYFAGRRTELINVGGNKVNPLRVEQVVHSVPGVTDVRVFARPSSLVGQMVACEYVVSRDHEPGTVQQEIARTCHERLAPYERPRFLQAVPEIRLSEAGKKVRKAN